MDGHFAVLWRLLKRFVEETESDFLTPEDIIDAVTYDGGIKNTVVDYVKVNRNHDTTRIVKVVERLRMVQQLGSPAEIKFERLEEGKYALNCYKYSGCQYERVLVDGFESIIDRKYKVERAIEKPEVQLIIEVLENRP